MQTRRSLLAAAVPLLLSGCIADTPPRDKPSPSPSQTTERSPAETDQPTTDTSTPDCMRGYTVSLSPFIPSEQLALPLRPSQQRLLARIIAKDGRVVKTYGRPPIRTKRYVNSEGAYYRVEYEQKGIETVPGRRANLSWEKGQTVPQGETAIAYSDLPKADQVALDFLIHGPAYSRQGLPSQGMSVRDSPAPYPQEDADSALVGAGTTWIEWENRIYNVTITTEKTTLTRRTYDYSASRVADSEEAFQTYAADRYLTPLDDLTSEEESLLDAAKANEHGRYEDCNEPSAAYTALEQRLENITALPAPHTNSWYVSYEGERYLLELSGWEV